MSKQISGDHRMNAMINILTSSRRAAFTGALLLTATVAGCGIIGPRTIPIAELVANPAAYEGKEIRVRGRADAIVKLPMIEPRFFTVSDGKTTLPVITYGDPPSTSEEVTVSGRFSTVAVLGAQFYGPHLTVGAPAAKK
jgi:predicted small lipoprotein YifL